MIEKEAFSDFSMHLCFPYFPKSNHRKKKRRSSLNSTQNESYLVLNRAMWIAKLRSLRRVTLILGISNMAVVVLGGILIIMGIRSCALETVLPVVVVSVASSVRIMVMIGTGFAQEATAKTILSTPVESSAVDAVIRHDRRMRYKRWLWWTRFALVVNVLQVVGAIYLLFIVVTYVSHDQKSSSCFLGPGRTIMGWKQDLVVCFLILVWFLVVVQCFTGSDILRWRSFYETHDNAWKAHYREVFDHGIREALCCLGRVKYLSVLEDDEIHSVARLLGDLVAYRASGTGHLELLAGLALLQRHGESSNSYEGHIEAPEEKIRDACIFHQFAEAAYTGPLLDFGRNPVLFPCVWLYRQGVLNPWTCRRRPLLEGDNWWRGHAAAFLKYVNLSPEALRRGRVSQEKCEAAYFIVVLHHLRCVVIAVRGTETPEDLITDSLCQECTLSLEDLDGLINSSNNVDHELKQYVLSSFPHYGHSGIVEASRELFMQIDGQTSNEGGLLKSNGFLSTLLGAGCECDGYSIRIVGHSLGGSIGALLGLRLYSKFPNLHVYAYGALPCVDSVIAEACSGFVTSIVYNDEFSARLSVSSILRLRAAAITALRQNSAADSAMVSRLARLFLHVSNYQESRIEENKETLPASSLNPCNITTNDKNHIYEKHWSAEQDQDFPFFKETNIMDNSCAAIHTDVADDFGTSTTSSHPCFETASDVISCEDPVLQFMDVVPSLDHVSDRDPKEMFLPGLVIHIIPQKKRSLLSLWRSWRVRECEMDYRAYIANRHNFKDIIVSPFMFLDHLPWRCHYAMQKVLETQKVQDQLEPDIDSLRRMYTDFCGVNYTSNQYKLASLFSSALSLGAISNGAQHPGAVPWRQVILVSISYYKIFIW